MPVEITEFDEVRIDPVEQKLREIILEEIDYKFCTEFLNRIEDSYKKNLAIDIFNRSIENLITQVPLNAVVSGPDQGIISDVKDFDNPETLKILQKAIDEEHEEMFLYLIDEYPEIDEFYALGIMTNFIMRFSDPGILDASQRGSIKDRVLDRTCYKLIMSNLNKIKDPSVREIVTDYYEGTVETIIAMAELALKDPCCMELYEDACRNYARNTAKLGYEHDFLPILGGLNAAKKYKDSLEPIDCSL